jgi:hypothetical protein
MARSKYPFEYELISEKLDKWVQWLTLWLKNEKENNLHNLTIQMHSIESFHIVFVFLFLTSTV